jgi:ankyrin repeat protein
VSVPLTPRTDTGTQSRSSGTNSVMRPWPLSPASSTSHSLFNNNNNNNNMSENWQGPLHIAARNGNNRITQLLVQHGTDCNEKDSKGCTPLMLAVVGGHEDVVSTLLSHGARVADTDAELRTVLHLAVLHRRADLLHTLLAECLGDTEIINGYDASGMTPLLMAIDVNFTAGVQTLLMVGADVASKARREWLPIRGTSKHDGS